MHRSKLGSQRHYGWTPSPPDFRDHVFAAPQTLVATALPPAFLLTGDLLPAPFNPVWNQGGIGSCGPHSACRDIVWAGFRQDNLTTVPMPSRLFVYWCARKLMGTLNQDSGVNNRALLKALHQFGWCDESMHRYADDSASFKQTPADKCFEQAAGRRITEYLAVPQRLDDMRACIAGGDGFIFGFSVYESLESPQVTKSGMVPLPRMGERQVGGHDVWIDGYDNAKRFAGGQVGGFRFCNSWGPHWGQNGYGWIPYDYACDPRLAGDFWTVRHSALPKPVAPDPKPSPSPSPSPTPTPAPSPTPAPVGPNNTTIIVDWNARKLLIDGKAVKA